MNNQSQITPGYFLTPDVILHNLSVCGMFFICYKDFFFFFNILQSAK